VDEPTLANARLAGDDGHLRFCGAEEPAKPLQLVGAPDHHGADSIAAGAHAARLPAGYDTTPPRSL
jgi:hypothetical protein